MDLLRDAWKIFKKYYGIPVLILAFLHLTQCLPERRVRAVGTETRPKSKAFGHSEMLLGAPRLDQSPKRRANAAKVLAKPTRKVGTINVAQMPNRKITVKAAQSPPRSNNLKKAQPRVANSLKVSRPSPSRFGSRIKKAKLRPEKARGKHHSPVPRKSEPRPEKKKDRGKRRKRTVIIGRRVDIRREGRRRYRLRPSYTRYNNNSVVTVEARNRLSPGNSGKNPPKTKEELEKEAEAYLESIDEKYARLCYADSVIGFAGDALGKVEGEEEDDDDPDDTTDAPGAEEGSMEYVEAEEGEEEGGEEGPVKGAKDNEVDDATADRSAAAKAKARGVAPETGTEDGDEGTEDENKQGEGDDDENDDPPTASELFLEFQDEIRDTLGNNFSEWAQFSNPLLRKEISIILKEGQGSMSDEDYERMYALQDKFEKIYNEGCTCEYKYREKCRGCLKKQYCTLKLEPEVDEIMAKSRDYDELVHYFNSWHWAVGTQIQAEDYAEYFRLNNQFATGNNFEGYRHVWAELYNEWTPGWNADKFADSVMSLWEEIKPHYKVLHSYVRMKLSEFPAYKGKIQRCGPIPVHLLGNMFGQTWVNIDDITKPYPNTPSLDASAEMRRQGYTPKKMLELADEFFQSLGLKKLPPEFWKNSVYTKPPNVGGCHPAAYDMGLGRYGQDYRLSMCATVNQKDFSTMHHELGHIQYMMQFANYRYAFRQAANPGFDESIGDALAMAVVTPEHLQCKLGLNLGVEVECDKSKQSKNFQITETDINFLYLTALESLAFFPFSIVIDTWRYLIMDEKLEAEDFNDKWWQMRRKIQGVVPPSRRPSNFFDAGAKFHVVRHNSYLRYFMSTILQFDFYESMCIAAGEYNPKDPNGKPVYRCDFTGSKKAGEKMGNMLKMGSQRPWPEALKAITGHTNVTVQPLLNYFKPMLDKLKELLEEGGQLDCLTHDTWS